MRSTCVHLHLWVKENNAKMKLILYHHTIWSIPILAFKYTFHHINIFIYQVINSSFFNTLVDGNDEVTRVIYPLLPFSGYKASQQAFRLLTLTSCWLNADCDCACKITQINQLKVHFRSKSKCCIFICTP